MNRLYMGLAAVLVGLLLSAGGYAIWLRGSLAQQALELAQVTRERDNLRSELTTAKVRLEQSVAAQEVTARSLARAQAATRELAAIKDWIRGNEDAPVPVWFDDLLVRLGFSLRDPASGSPDGNSP